MRSDNGGRIEHTQYDHPSSIDKGHGTHRDEVSQSYHPDKKHSENINSETKSHPSESNDNNHVSESSNFSPSLAFTSVSLSLSRFDSIRFVLV